MSTPISINKVITGKKVKSESVRHSCPTLPSVHGILEARILEWIAIPFSRGSF